MSSPQQLEFFFSLDFPGRSTLYMGEVADKLGVTRQHIATLVDVGELDCVNLAARQNTRPCVRIPIESYRNFIVRRMRGAMRAEFLSSLPKSTLKALRDELDNILKQR